MTFSTETYIRLTDEMVHKLNVISTSIQETTSQKQLVEGGIDLMFSNALRFLYRDGEITKSGLENGLEMLEDYLAEKTRKEIEKEINT